MALGNEQAVRAVTPLSEHDIEHRNLRLQLFVMRQLVLRLYAELHGEKALDLVCERLGSVRDTVGDKTLHPAEQALLLDESADVLAEVEEHMELVLAGAL